MQRSHTSVDEQPLRSVIARNRAGRQEGIYSLCSAHPRVIRAALEIARDRDQIALVESTCNQVNQDGGYTGLTPQQFADRVRAVARDVGLREDRLVLGGDHLGPQPWRKMPAVIALAKAVTMVECYARAGYGKLHLDCSMACADDPEFMTDVLIATRAARLAQAAEAALTPPTARPVYVVGTEVPPPGGMGQGHSLIPTAPRSVLDTWCAHQKAFEQANLTEAFTRVIAIVVQPGLDFANEDVAVFEPGNAAELAKTVLALEGAVYEAHSTDYQAPESYRALIGMHFAILKVGPAATFALREAIYGLELIARELPGWSARYSVRAALEAAMLANPVHWASYYPNDAKQIYLRHFSYSDRLRYYWTESGVEAAVAQLFAFLDEGALPLPLISQFLPQHLRAVADGDIAATAAALCNAHIMLALTPYADACGTHAPDTAEK